MLDVRYIAGALIVTVAIIAGAIKLFGPADTTTTATATLKPRIEPSRIVEQPAPETAKQTAAPATPAAKQAAAPAKTQTAPAEITGSIGEQKPAAEAKPAPKRAVQARKKEEQEFQWPLFRGFGQNWNE